MRSVLSPLVPARGLGDLPRALESVLTAGGQLEGQLEGQLDVAGEGAAGPGSWAAAPVLGQGLRGPGCTPWPVPIPLTSL